MKSTEKFTSHVQGHVTNHNVAASHLTSHSSSAQRRIWFYLSSGSQWAFAMLSRRLASAIVGIAVLTSSGHLQRTKYLGARYQERIPLSFSQCYYTVRRNPQWETLIEASSPEALNGQVGARGGWRWSDACTRRVRFLQQPSSSSLVTCVHRGCVCRVGHSDLWRPSCSQNLHISNVLGVGDYPHVSFCFSSDYWRSFVVFLIYIAAWALHVWFLQWHSYARSNLELIKKKTQASIPS